jgi:hypothetical protein
MHFWKLWGVIKQPHAARIPERPREHSITRCASFILPRDAQATQRLAPHAHVRQELAPFPQKPATSSFPPVCSSKIACKETRCVIVILLCDLAWALPCEESKSEHLFVSKLVLLLGTINGDEVRLDVNGIKQLVDMRHYFLWLVSE